MQLTLLDDVPDFRRQQECKHIFIETQSMDYERDEIYDIRVCIKCGFKEI
ncbi:MAG: hypothetical protein U9M94_01575 [Patescibacteria group bacterium]|nr:hypothetical protein [Patescibacteria group bacterium]